MGQNAQLRGAARQHRPARAGLPVVASGDAGARHQRRRQRAPVHRAGRRRARQGRVPRACSTAWSTARTRAKASCAAGSFLHPKLGFTFTAPEGFTLDNTAQAVFGVKDGGAQALRLDVVRVPAEQTLADYLISGWIENIEPQERRGVHRQRLPGGDRDRERRPVDVPALRGALRQRGLSRHLRRQEPHRGGRPHVPRLRSTASAACRSPRCSRRSRSASRWWRSSAATRWSGSPAAWRSATATSSGSACSTGSGRMTAVKPGDLVKIVVE